MMLKAPKNLMPRAVTRQLPVEPVEPVEPVPVEPVEPVEPVDCGLWTVDCGLWTVDCGLWALLCCGLWTADKDGVLKREEIQLGDGQKE